MKVFFELSIYFNIVLYTLSLALFIVAPEYNTFNLWMLGASIVFSLSLMINKRKEIIHFIKHKNLKYFSIEITSIGLLLMIVAMVNYISHGHGFKIDITKEKFNSLSDLSINSTKSLNSTVEVTLFAKKADWQKYLRILNMYKEHNDLLDIKAVDIERNPNLVKIHNIQENGTVHIRYQGKEFSSVLTNELSFTNLLIKVARKKQTTIHYLSGYKGLDFNSTDNEGAKVLKDKILDSGVDLKSISLREKLDKKVNHLLVMNPTEEFTDFELSNLEAFLKRGGHILLSTSVEFSKGSQKLFDLVEKYTGIKKVNAIIIDQLATQQGAQASVPVVNEFNKSHSITKSMAGRLLFPLSSFFKVSQKENWITNILAASTNFPATWGETNFEELKTGRVSFNQESDFKGPLAIAGAFENSQTKQRVVYLGSSQFLTNQYAQFSNNVNFFLNALHWFSNDEPLISLDRPETQGSPVFLSQMHISIIFYLSVLILPITFLMLGLFRFRQKAAK